jgi:hypothetical protein
VDSLKSLEKEGISTAENSSLENVVNKVVKRNVKTEENINEIIQSEESIPSFGKELNEKPEPQEINSLEDENKRVYFY